MLDFTSQAKGNSGVHSFCTKFAPIHQKADCVDLGTRASICTSLPWNKVFDVTVLFVTYIIYRNVVLNLRIETSETARLGLEQHICELQLNLRDFAELLVHNPYLRPFQSRLS